jgi:HPt (histidine-containing phosphotransfer) domain-containing protein
MEDGADQSFVRTVMTSFLSSSPDFLEQLRLGCGTRDAGMIRSASHMLKSSSAVIGATALSDCCARVEATVRQGKVEEAIALVAGVMEEYQNIRPAIEAHASGAAECLRVAL